MPRLVAAYSGCIGSFVREADGPSSATPAPGAFALDCCPVWFGWWLNHLDGVVLDFTRRRLRCRGDVGPWAEERDEADDAGGVAMRGLMMQAMGQIGTHG